MSLFRSKPSREFSYLNTGLSPNSGFQSSVCSSFISTHLQPSPPCCCFNITAVFLLQGFCYCCTLPGALSFRSCIFCFLTSSKSLPSLTNTILTKVLACCIFLYSIYHLLKYDVIQIYIFFYFSLPPNRGRFHF